MVDKNTSPKLNRRQLLSKLALVPGTDKVDKAANKARFTRRQFLKDGARATAIGATVGTAAGTGTYFGLDYLGSILGGIGKKIEEEARAVYADAKELVGVTQKRIETQNQTLEDNLERISGDYQEDGNPIPKEITDLESTIERNREIRDRYFNYRERGLIFLDRQKRRASSLDTKLEDIQPGPMKWLNDKIRGTLGKPTGEEGVEYRKSFKTKLDGLCMIYDQEENLSRAKLEVMKKLNTYLRNPNAPTEEKGLFQFWIDGLNANEDDLVKDMIEHYQMYDDYSNKVVAEYNAELNGLNDELEHGVLKLREQIRKTPESDFMRKREVALAQIETALADSKQAVKYLEAKGYDIETRDKEIKKGTISKMVSEAFDPVRDYTALAVGGVLGVKSFISSMVGQRKTRKLKAYEQAHDTLVDAQNIEVERSTEAYELNADLAQENATLESKNLALNTKIETHKNIDFPGYNGGNDYY